MSPRLVSLIAAALCAPLAAQSGTLDQQSPFGNASFNGGSSTLLWQLEVEVGVTGTLEGVTMEALSSVPGTVDVTLRAGAGWNTGAAGWTGVLATQGLGTWESIFLDMSSAGLQFAAGDLFVIEVTGSTSGMNLKGDYQAPPATPPYPRELFLNGNVYANGGWRIGFETYMLSGPAGPTLDFTGPCPGPGALTLSGAGANATVPVAWSTMPSPLTLGSGPCAGTTIGLSNLRLLTVLQADGNGAASLPATAPPAACGNVHLQAIDLSSCTPSNVLTL